MKHRFATAECTVLPEDRASVLFDGVFSQPRLQHPECVAVGPDGSIWAGSENGQILSLKRDGSGIEEIATTGGFVLGLAFDADRALFVCDLKHAAVFRLDLATRRLDRFSAPGIVIPNSVVVDGARNRILVSDSHHFSRPGPGIWSYDLSTGSGQLWYAEPLVFANGMALAPDGASITVCETFARRIASVAIQTDGRAGVTGTVADDLPGLPDGLAYDDHGALFVGCYEPSRILRIPAGGGRVDIYIEDPTAHLFAHPTNIAFDGSELFAANLGRWHITRIATDTFGTRLCSRKTPVRE
jgi:sugar lactone lactonase YvrE